MTRKPAIGMVAVAGRRQASLEMAKRLEQEGFDGIYCPSLTDNLAFCTALAFATQEMKFGTSITNLYARHPQDFARTSAFIHEVSNGHFRFGVGVSHGPTHARMGIVAGKPLGNDARGDAYRPAITPAAG